MSQYFNPIEGKRNYVDTVTVTDNVLSSVDHVCIYNWYYWSQSWGWHMTNTIVTNDVSVTWADTSTTASGDPSMCVCLPGHHLTLWSTLARPGLPRSMIVHTG